jgi:hypothetical protein
MKLNIFLMQKDILICKEKTEKLTQENKIKQNLIEKKFN